MFGGVFAGAQVFQISGGQVEVFVVINAHVNDIAEVEQLIVLIFCVVHLGVARLDVLLLDIFHVDKHRLYGLYRTVFNHLHKIALVLAVDFDGGVFRFLHLVNVGGFALAFVNNHVIVLFKVLFCKCYNLLLGDVLQHVQGFDLFFPRNVQIESLFHRTYTAFVAFVLLDFAQAQVVDAGLQQPFGKVALLQFLNLFQQNVTNLFQ